LLFGAICGSIGVAHVDANDSNEQDAAPLQKASEEVDP
jgi:hypothetical protein